MSRVGGALSHDLHERFAAAGDAERARGQQAYMKSEMPFYGVTAPELRRIAKAVFAERPIEDAETWLASVLEVWRSASHREARHAAIELLLWPKYKRAWLDPQCFDALEEMITTGAWWDYVDAIATQAVHHIMLTSTHATTRKMRAWSRRSNLWLRRTSIICQLKRRQDTDLDLLSLAIRRSLADDNFFARKGIGWALREYSKTDPEWVVAFLLEHREQLSALSKREALKVLKRQGVPLPEPLR